MVKICLTRTAVIRIKKKQVTKTMKIIGQVVDGTVFNRVIKYKNKLYKMTYDNRVNAPLGFDNRFKAEVWTGEQWEIIGGKEKVGFEQTCHSKNHQELEEDADRFFDLIGDYVVKTY